MNHFRKLFHWKKPAYYIYAEENVVIYGHPLWPSYSYWIVL